MSNPKLIYNPFTDYQILALDQLVKEGRFKSRSEALRYAVDLMFKVIDDVSGD